MKFIFNEKRSDLYTLIKELEAAEQSNRAARGDNELRALLNLAAHRLEDCRTLLIGSVTALEEAVQLRAGLMDTSSRHEEVARLKNRAMESVAEFMKSVLTQYTPPQPEQPTPRFDEVI